MTGQELKKLRNAAALTQRQLAEKVGLTPGPTGRVTIARWETGTRRITEPMARLLTILLTP